MGRLFRIGEVSRLFSISPETLRHYEKMGILTPERIDESSGFRYYGTRQFEVLNTVKYLRMLDMPLEEIAGFLKNRDVGVIKEKLEKQKKIISEKRRELEIIEKKIDNRLEILKIAESGELNKIKTVRTKPFRIVRMMDSVRLKNYLDLEGPIRALDSADKKTVVLLGKVGVGISPEHLLAGEYSVYDSVFLLLDDEEEFAGDIESVPAERCVSVKFKGSHESAPEQYDRLNKYMREHNLVPAGHSREVTLVDEGLTSDHDKFVTEIKIPVKKER